MADEDGEMRPRIIDTSRYVKDRIDQIAELLEAVDTRPRAIGPGRRTAFQRLPRHMRRRAMSHNVRRLPRSIRPIAGESARHRNKPPSRLWRRRPSRALKRINRLKRRNVWLETHIWHAKRFRMQDLWGYKLPIASYQRGFRPTYRNSVHSTCVIDQSYLHCLQVVVGDASVLDALVGRLNQLCAPTVAPTFGFKPALDGGVEASTLLYRPGSYPRGFIGPVMFSWSTSVTEESGAQSRQLQMWTHPSTQPLATTTLLELLDVKKDGEEGMEDGDSDELYNRRYDGAGFKIYDLRQRLARFQLIGPKALKTLHSALRLVNDSQLSASGLLSAFGPSHDFWRESAVSLQPANLRSGSIISLLVEDPRTYRSDLLSRASKKPAARSYPSEAPAPSQHFWSAAFRREQWKRRMSSAELQAHHSKCLGRVSSPSKIPVLVVVKSAPANSLPGSNPLNRIDLVVPGGWGLDFWLALQFSNARASGLRDKLHLDFEAGMVNFPADCPDSSAGEAYRAVEEESLEAKHLRKPSGKRIPYASRLHVNFPFSFRWTQLVDEWADGGCSGESSAPYVLRDRHALMQLSRWWDGKSKDRPGDVFTSHRGGALIEVRLKLLARGCPKRLALICLPSEEDASEIREDRRVTISEAEPARVEEDSPWLTTPDKIDMLLSLDEMFPDHELREVRRGVAKRQKRSERRKAVKRRKRGGGVSAALPATEDGAELMNVEEAAYKDSCSRAIVGRVARGDYSFSNGQGIAYGYVPLAALNKICEARDDRLVLLRNTTSKYYHPARLSVVAWTSILP